jgi:hypothetical protein
MIEHKTKVDQQVIDDLTVIADDYEEALTDGYLDRFPLANFYEQNNLAFPWAKAVKWNWITLQEEGEKIVLRTYNYLVDVANARGLESIGDLNYYSQEPVPLFSYGMEYVISEFNKNNPKNDED